MAEVSRDSDPNTKERKDEKITLPLPHQLRQWTVDVELSLRYLSRICGIDEIMSGSDEHLSVRYDR